MTHGSAARRELAGLAARGGWPTVESGADSGQLAVLGWGSTYGVIQV